MMITKLTRRSRRSMLLLAACMSASALATTAQAAIWDGSANDGVYFNGANWDTDPVVPNGVGAVAEFGNIASTLTHTITNTASVTLGSIIFSSNNQTSGGYTISPNNTTNSYIIDNGASTALIKVDSTNGNAGHSLGSGANLMTLNSNLNIVVDTTSTLEGIAFVSATASPLTITKSGIGSAVLRGGSLSSNFGSGSNPISWVITGGRIAVDSDAQFGHSANTVTLNGGMLRSFTGTVTMNRQLAIGSDGGTLDVSSSLVVNNLTGSGTLFKTGATTLVVNNANTGFTGGVSSQVGIIDATSNAAALGTHSSAAGKLMVGGFAGQISLNDASLNGRYVHVGQGGGIAGTATGTANAVMASLNRANYGQAGGGNLLINQEGILLFTGAGQSSLPQNLGTASDLLLGYQGTIAAENHTLGTGTAWAGLAAGRSNGTLQSGVLTLNSDIILGAAGTGYLTLGNLAASKVDFSSTTPRQINIKGYGALNGSANVATVRISGNDPILNGQVSKIVVDSTAVLDPKGVDSFDGVAVDVLVGGIIGDRSQVGTGANTGNQQINSYGTSTITLMGANQINIRRSGAAAVEDMGGNFVVDGSVPVTFDTNQANPADATTRIYTINSLTFDTAGTAKHTGGNNKGLGIKGITAGANDFMLSPETSGNNSMNIQAGAIVSGSGVMTKSDVGELRIGATISGANGFTGSIYAKQGLTVFNTGVTTDRTIRIGDGNTLENDARGYAQVTINADFAPTIASNSTGVLALGVNNNSITSLSGQMFLGASANVTLNNAAPTVLGVGANNTYRLGAGGSTLTIGANVSMGGANNLVIGGYRNDLTGGSLWNSGLSGTTGSGTVTLQSSSSYTGTTRINPSSVLNLQAANAIGGDGVNSAGNIDIYGTLNITGTASTLRGEFNSQINVQAGGALNIAGGNTLNRIPNTVDINIIGGTVGLTGVASQTTNEVVGDVTFGQDARINLTRGGAGAPTILTVASLTRSGKGTLTLAAPNTLGGDERLINSSIGSAASLVNPYIVNSTGNGNFVQVNASGSYSNATYSGAGINTTVSTDIYNTGAAQTMTVANAAVRALRMGHSIGQGAGTSTTVTIGNAGDTEAGIIAAANVTLGANGTDSSVIDFGGREAVVYVNSGNTLTVGSTTTLQNTGGNGLTKFGLGTLVLTGTNSFTGTITVNTGVLTLASAVSNDIVLNPFNQTTGNTQLNLRSNTSQTLVSSGTITVNSLLTGGGTNGRTVIDVNNNGAGTNNRIDINNLTVSDDARLAFQGGNGYNLGVLGALTLGNRAVLHMPSNNGVQLEVRGTYSDTSTSVLGNNNDTAGGSGAVGINFATGGTVNVNAIIRGNITGGQNRPQLRASNNTTVNYNGYLLAESQTFIQPDAGSRIVFGSTATIDSSAGWTGTTYSAQQTGLFGTGELELSSGFKAKKTVGTGDRTDVNWGGEVRLGGLTLVTNHSDNLSDYQAYLQVDSNDSGWRSQTNAQSFALPIFVRGVTLNVQTDSNMTWTGPVSIGANASVSTNLAAITRDWQLNGVLNLPQDFGIPAAGRINKSGNSTLTIDGPVLVSETTAIHASAGSVALNGKLVTTAGANVLELSTAGSGAITFNSSIDVGAGETLRVRTNGASNVVNINSGKFVTGHGEVLNAVRINSGGSITPGSSPGILTVGGLEIASGASYVSELNGAASAGNFYDQIDVKGTVTLAGNLSAILNYVPTLGDNLWIINNDGNDAVSGIFAGLANDSIFSLISTVDMNTYYFRIRYNTDFFTANNGLASGNDVVLTNVEEPNTGIPEPASLGILGLGAAALLMRRRR